jgi:Spx/MgsR family transcriptional regulator
MLTIYGIANCDTCRNAKKWLDTNDIEYSFHDLRNNGLEIQMLERWAANVDWEKLVNRRSRTWRDFPKSARQQMTKTGAMAAMIEHPTLVKRPVLESERFIAVGFTPEQYSEIFR